MNKKLLSWAVSRWTAEVKNRPISNTHRRTLDDTWRQVIVFAGGDPDKLLGPSHDTLVCADPAPSTPTTVTVSEIAASRTTVVKPQSFESLAASLHKRIQVIQIPTRFMVRLIGSWQWRRVYAMKDRYTPSAKIRHMVIWNRKFRRIDFQYLEERHQHDDHVGQHHEYSYPQPPEKDHATPEEPGSV